MVKTLFKKKKKKKVDTQQLGATYPAKEIHIRDSMCTSATVEETIAAT